MTTTYSWYVSPEQQLERVKQLNIEQGWGFSEADFPSVPKDVSLNEAELLLLAVYLPDEDERLGLQRTVDELWDLIEASNGYIKRRWDKLIASPDFLRQVSGYSWKPGIRWVIFNPTAYHGKPPSQALELSKVDGVQLAGVEILMGAVLFPTWQDSWIWSSIQNWPPSPWLSGLQHFSDAAWSRTPFLERSDGRMPCLKFQCGWGTSVVRYSCSPSFREC